MACIIFSRVSTALQTLEQQEHQLISAAKQDGYREDEMIIISETESAVKNNMSDRLGLTKAKQRILNGDIEILYAAEISRLARRLDVFYEFRSFLVEHHVQLRILNPDVKLLNKDGNIDENFTLVFSIFASLAESEARLMKSRLARGKKERRSANKFCDGNPCFGYIREDDGTISVNPAEADLVRTVFMEYDSGKTVDEIARALIMDGMDKTLDQARNFCFHILHNVVYKGFSSSENVYCNPNVTTGYVYPQIVSEELFDKVDRTFKKRGQRKKNTKHNWMLRGILVDHLGHPYNVHPSNGAYYCKYSDKNGVYWSYIKKIKVEDFIWSKVSEKRSGDVLKSDERLKKIDIRIKENEILIADTASKISKIDESIKKLEYRIITGKISEQTGEEFEYSLKVDRDKLVNEKTNIEHENAALILKKTYIKNGGKEDDGTLTEEEKTQIVNEEIKQIVTVKNGRTVTLGILWNECDDPQVMVLN